MAINFAQFTQNPIDVSARLSEGFGEGFNRRVAIEDRARQVELRRREDAAEAAQQEAALQQQADLSALFVDKTATASDYNRLLLKHPDLAERLQEPIEAMSNEEVKVRQEEALNVFSAIDSGQTDIAEDLLNRKLEAAENSGNQRDADAANALLQLLEINPDGAKASAGLLLASTMGEDEFENFLTAIRSEDRERQLLPGILRKQAADLGLTQSQIATATKGVEKTDAETQKLALEIESLQSGDQIIPVEKKFDFEDKLRDEFVKRTENSTKIENAFRTVESAEDSAAGDLALIFAFMKMLDPGSVVREGEFATAQNTTGIPGRVLNAYNKALTGERLNPVQRKEFSSQAKSTLKASRKRIEETRNDLEFPIKNFGLSRENVFGTRAAGEKVPVGEVDASTLSDADLDAEIARLQGQQ